MFQKYKWSRIGQSSKEGLEGDPINKYAPWVTGTQ